MAPPLGIVVALPIEARTLRASPPGPGECIELACGALLWVSGMGRERTARAAAGLIERGAGALMSWGTAAGLAPDAVHGEVLVPGAIVSGDERLEVDRDWHRRVRAALSGPGARFDVVMAEATEVLTSPRSKRELHERSGALAADMESATVARAARAAGIPFLALRAVTDEAATALPVCVTAAAAPDGRLRLLSLLTALARRPRDLGALVEVARGFRLARASLERSAGELRPHFGLSVEPLEPARG